MPKIDHALWRDTMNYLRNHHGSICRQWFDDLEPIDLTGGLFTVYASDAIHQNYLQRKCREQFTEAAQHVTGALVAVKFVTGDLQSYEQAAEAGTLNQPTATQTNSSNNSNLINSSMSPATNIRRLPSEGTLDDEMVISPDYSFDNFVTGAGNDLAYAAANAVADQPGTAYNPLFIHGGVGLGKTHLLQAICQVVIAKNPNHRICYLSCETFMNHFLDCVQSGQMNEFRHRYRHVDLLVIDDIHFLANRDRTQEEFFHTFNALYQNKRQIVLSSDRHPSEIPKLEERLISRFGWGLVTTVTKPDYETRVAIIRAKSRLRNLVLPDDVIDYIATKIDSNARELEGALITIQGHASLKNQPADLALAYRALGELEVDTGRSQVTLQHIIDTVTSFYTVKLSDLQSKRRHKSITEPRQICMWLARKRTRFSLEEIGGYFGGRDHTTVMHSIKTVDERTRQDPHFSNQLETLQEQLARITGV